MINEHPTRPCVGCGYCCRKAQCVVGLKAYGGAATYCPGLVWIGSPALPAGGRYYCKLVLDEQARGIVKVALDLCIGEGCCSSLNTERRRFLPAHGEPQAK